MHKRAESSLHLSGLPGAEIVESGLRDLRAGERTESALLVLIAGPRMKRLGLEIPERSDIARPYEHALYALLEETQGDGAYSRYNSLIRRIVSFSRALEQQVSKSRTESGPESGDS